MFTLMVWKDWLKDNKVIYKAQMNVKLMPITLQSAFSPYIMLAQIKDKSGIAINQKRKANVFEDEITPMVEEIEARQHVLFGGLTSRLTNKAKH